MSKGRPSGGFNGEKSSDLGRMLGNARASKGFSLKAVAKVVGISAGFVSGVEHGRVPLPTKHVAKFAEALGLDFNVVESLRLAEKVVRKADAKLKKLKNAGTTTTTVSFELPAVGV